MLHCFCSLALQYVVWFGFDRFVVRMLFQAVLDGLVFRLRLSILVKLF